MIRQTKYQDVEISNEYSDIVVLRQGDIIVIERENIDKLIKELTKIKLLGCQK